MSDILHFKANNHGKPLLPLAISVKRRTWRMADTHASDRDSVFQDKRLEVLSRDNYTCRFCRFNSPPNKKGLSYLEVHHLDDDHGNNNLKNLVTACNFCHMVHHIGFAGMMNRGVMIYLPEIPQAYLSHITRAILMAIIDDSSYSAQALSIQSTLESRSFYIEEVFGATASDPKIFGQAMLDADADKINYEALKGVRFLPYPTSFIELGNFYANHVFSGIPPESWAALAKPEIDFESILKAKYPQKTEPVEKTTKANIIDDDEYNLEGVSLDESNDDLMVVDDEKSGNHESEFDQSLDELTAFMSGNETLNKNSSSEIKEYDDDDEDDEASR